MPVINSNKSLCRHDLHISLSNEYGYKTDPYLITWTIYNSSGHSVSGRNVVASRITTGEYYANWISDVPGGSYKIIWMYKEKPESCENVKSQNFTIIDQNDVVYNDGITLYDVTDLSDNVFLIGSVLGPSDLHISLYDSEGAPINAQSVVWWITDSYGCRVSQEHDAIQTYTGKYYANWFVNVLGGDYIINWKVIETQSSPSELFKNVFSVISPAINICSYSGIITPIPHNLNSACLIKSSLLNSCYNEIYSSNCHSMCSPHQNETPMTAQQANCCPFEIPRTVHLSEQLLPIGGAYTNQIPYNIPSRIRSIAFYIRYRRNLSGGRASLKLLWGNGIEETQSTLVDLAYDNTNDEVSEQNMFLNTYKGPMPIDDDFIGFQIETTVPAGAKLVRLIASEYGQPMQPGIIAITLTAAS